MFGRLVQKELAHHVLEFRYFLILAMAVALSVLSGYVGAKRYGQELQEYSGVTENNRRGFQENSLDKGRLIDLIYRGYKWNRRPEPLGTVVKGLSRSAGKTGRIRYLGVPQLEGSSYEADPAELLFESLDFAVVVRLILSLCAVILVYDAVCGEKERGTLKLLAAHPVSRATLALAKYRAGQVGLSERYEQLASAGTLPEYSCIGSTPSRSGGTRCTTPSCAPCTSICSITPPGSGRSRRTPPHNSRISRRSSGGMQTR